MNEEEQSIEWLKRLVKINKRDNLNDTFAEILLNLIEKQQKELEKKNAVIDKMAEMLVKVPENIDEPEKLSLVHFLNEHLEEKKQRVINYILNLVEKENK